MMYCVYKHTNNINGKIYIGITCQDVNRRWRNGYGYRKNKYFYRSILKYGWDNFSHEILFNNLTHNQACEKEIQLISEYKTTNAKYGYNETSGGDGSLGRKHTQEELDKISKRNKGENNPNYNHKWSEEKKKAFSDYMKTHSSNYWLNKKRSLDDRKAISKGKKGKYTGEDNPNAHKVIKLDINNNVIMIYNTILEASEKNNLHKTTISRCCRKLLNTAGGYKWRYYNDNDK